MCIIGTQCLCRMHMCRLKNIAVWYLFIYVQTNSQSWIYPSGDYEGWIGQQSKYFANLSSVLVSLPQVDYCVNLLIISLTFACLFLLHSSQSHQIDLPAALTSQSHLPPRNIFFTWIPEYYTFLVFLLPLTILLSPLPVSPHLPPCHPDP